MVGDPEEDTDVIMDDRNGDDTRPSDVPSSGISCSICLDFVIGNGSRSTAKLQCGHEFHLDCIGSAFNIKGEMQCPNCRKVERGRWLYASGSAFSFPEFTIEDWTPDEDPYESYSEMPSRVHWCPFSGLVRVHSSLEEVESPSTTYHSLHRHHAVFADPDHSLHRHHAVFADQQTAASSVAHAHVAYVGHPPPTTSNTNESVEDPNFNHRLNGLSGHNETVTAHTFPVIGIRHQNRAHHSHHLSANSGHVNSADQAATPPATERSTRGEHDALRRSGSVVHPFPHGHGNARFHQRIPAAHAIHHHLHRHPSNPPGVPLHVFHGVRRSNIPRGVPPAVIAASQSDQSGGFLVSPPPGSSGQNPHETENSLPNPFHARERDTDPGAGSFHHAGGGSEASNRSGSHWHRH